MTTICPQCGSDRVSERHIGRKTGGIAGGFDIKNSDIIYGVMEDKFGNSALIVQKSDYSKVLAEIELDSGDKNYVNKLMNILSDV